MRDDGGLDKNGGSGDDKRSQIIIKYLGNKISICCQKIEMEVEQRYYQGKNTFLAWTTMWLGWPHGYREHWNLTTGLSGYIGNPCGEKLFEMDEHHQGGDIK